MMVDIENLPQPNEGFAWAQAAGGPALVCRLLDPVATHLFTTSPWLLGQRSGSGTSEEVPAEWREVADAVEVAPSELMRLHQVHGATVVVVKETLPSRPNADIIVTKDERFALAVQSADCVPLLVADRDTGAVAAAHAGWRGLAVRVPGATVAALLRECGCRRGNLIAAIGPSIGSCCYEVGPDVYERFCRSGFTGDQLGRWFLGSPTGDVRNPSMPAVRMRARRADHWFFDAWTATADQLRGAGLSEDQILVAGLCTASHPGVLCSYRRDGSGAGRIAAAIRSRSRRP